MDSEDIILPAIILPSKVLKAHLAELQEAEVKNIPSGRRSCCVNSAPMAAWRTGRMMMGKMIRI